MGKKSAVRIEVQSIVAADTILEGTFYAKSAARIDGTIKGSIRSEGTLFIGENGKVEGNIHARQIFIAGEVRGDLFADEKIEASATGKIYGDIKTMSLIIDENAVFQGKCETNVKQDAPGSTVSEEIKAVTAALEEE